MTVAYGQSVTVQDASLAVEQAMARLVPLSPNDALAKITAGALNVPPTATVQSTQNPNLWQAINSNNPAVSDPAIQQVDAVAIAIMAQISPAVGLIMALGLELEKLLQGIIGTPPPCQPGHVATPGEYFPVVPSGFAAALAIPLATDQTSYNNQCWSPFFNGVLGYNVYAALLAYAWNGHAQGPTVDYFVPLLNDPTRGEFEAGAQFSNGTNILGWTNGIPGSLFLLPAQAPYAFQPMSKVPANILAPMASLTGQPVSSFEYLGGNYGDSNGLYGPSWSRLSAKSGPLLTTSQKALEAVALVGGAAAALALGVGAYSLIKGRSFFSVARSIPGSIERIF